MSNVIEFKPREEPKADNPLNNSRAHTDEDKKEYIRLFEEVKKSRPQNKYQYLRMCKLFLIGDTYEEVLCSIMDNDYYVSSTVYVKKIVDVYFEYNA